MTFEDYSLDFQLDVLRLIYHDPDFAATISDTVTADHFDLKIHSVYAKMFLDYAIKYPREPITRPIVYLEIKKLIDRKKILEEEKPEFIYDDGFFPDAGFHRRLGPV